MFPTPIVYYGYCVTCKGEIKISVSPEIDQLLIEVVQQAMEIVAQRVKNKYPAIKHYPDWLLHYLATVNPALMLGQGEQEWSNGWSKTRFEIFRRDGFRCVYCGRTVKDGVRLTVDHIVPRSKKGSSAMSNLVTACHICNEGKDDTELTEEEKSLIGTVGKPEKPLTI